MPEINILIVEDEMLISTSIKTILGQEGFKCTVTDNGEDAIKMIQEPLPQLLIMDIGLKGKLDGVSTASIIRRRSQVPIIFISDQSSRQVFELAKGARPANFLTKPFSDGELVKAVELALCQTAEISSTEPDPQTVESVPDGLFAFSNGEYKKITFTEILFIQADGMHTIIYCTNNKTFRISLSSNHVISQINLPYLVRTGKSSYVNFHKVDSIRGDELKLERYSVTLSKTYREDFLAKIIKLKQMKPE